MSTTDLPGNTDGYCYELNVILEITEIPALLLLTFLL